MKLKQKILKTGIYGLFVILIFKYSKMTQLLLFFKK
jgi:hypothetical protein